MSEGDLDSLLSLYDNEVVFLNQSGEEKKGVEALRDELAPFAAAKATFDYSIKQVIQTCDLALMHTRWSISSPAHMSLYEIEVARRQQDGMWRWQIGDPFTVVQLR
jgi:ketosteroid isomerase-like protein